MVKSEFSETQFVFGYLREIFDFYPWRIGLFMPSTRDEKRWASDAVLRYYTSNGHFRYSEFYQFKRSKFFNAEIFDSLRSTINIDTGIKPKYGFNIYNSDKSRQFNVLQRLARQPRCRVYYCAPMFHTLKEFGRYFAAGEVVKNSRLFPFNQNAFQRIRIPLNSSHQIIFDRNEQFICSDPIRIEGFSAEERAQFVDRLDASADASFYDHVTEIHSIIMEEIRQYEYFSIETPPVNYYEVRDLLLTYFDIYWELPIHPL